MCDTACPTHSLPPEKQKLQNKQDLSPWFTKCCSWFMEGFIWNAKARMSSFINLWVIKVHLAGTHVGTAQIVLQRATKKRLLAGWYECKDLRGGGQTDTHWGSFVKITAHDTTVKTSDASLFGTSHTFSQKGNESMQKLACQNKKTISLQVKQNSKLQEM